MSSSGKYFIGNVEIDDSVFDEEKVEYCIREREEIIDDLIGWIGEGNKDKELMKDDLKMLINRDEEFLFSSYSTNEYVFEGDDDFNSICKNVLKLDEDIKRSLEDEKV